VKRLPDNTSPGCDTQVPFALLATAYRRKRIMEGLFTGDREVMAQVSWGASVCVMVQLYHRVLRCLDRRIVCVGVGEGCCMNVIQLNCWVFLIQACC
jgi:hypothetical protein